MSDLVVTVPRNIWRDWLAEGDLPGDAKPGAFEAYDFTCGSASHPRPPIAPGERVYVVAHGMVRGYSPLVEVASVEGRWSLVRRGGAVACTIPDSVRGFRGWRERWWDRTVEKPFPEWMREGVKLECDYCSDGKKKAVGAFTRSGLTACAWCVVDAERSGLALSPRWHAAIDFSRPIVEAARAG